MTAHAKRPLFRVVAPAYPALNIYSRIANKTTALGPLMVATVVNRMQGWQAEVVDENNFAHMPLKERVRHFRRFIRQARLDTIQVLLPVPLPGTELAQRLKAQGWVFATDIVGWQYYDGNFPLFQPDPPLTPAQLQTAWRQIMGRFYRFRSLFVASLNLILFPVLLTARLQGKPGWYGWPRVWRNACRRFGGWLLLKNWQAALKKDGFQKQLAVAQQSLAMSEGQTASVSGR